ncbi:MAG: CRISPR-associated endonuclease Cas2 [Planctomycetota bacterium]
MAKKWYLVTYDVRESRRLRRTAKHLEGYGTRIQYSIFRCKLRPREMERLQWELTKILEPEDDLLIIGLCGDCAERIRCRTGKDDWTAEETSFQVV